MIGKSPGNYIHTGHSIFTIACNMKPCARIDKGSIPALKNIAWISYVGLKCIEGITCVRRKTILRGRLPSNIVLSMQHSSSSQLSNSIMKLYKILDQTRCQWLCNKSRLGWRTLGTAAHRLFSSCPYLTPGSLRRLFEAPAYLLLKTE